MKPGPTSYLVLLAGIVLAGLTALAAWNRRVDPYDLYASEKRQGWNHFNYLAAGPQQRMVTAHHIRRMQPDGLILGTSRVDWAIDPDHPRLGEVTPLFYNAALNGCTMYEAWRYVQHAHATRPLQAVLIGLDIEMFNTVLRREGDMERRLAVDAEGRPQPGHARADRVSTLITADAWAASRKTIKQSGKFRDRSREELMQRGGEFQESQIHAGNIFDAFNARWAEGQRNLSALGTQRALIEQRLSEYYRRFVDLAYREDMQVFQFITPYHYTLLDIIHDSGNGPVFEDWKRRLVEINAEAAARYGREPSPIWDFSGYNRITLDTPPTPDAPGRLMTWYMECSHYRKRVGDQILERMFGGCDAPGDFGRCLTAENLETRLAALRKERAERE